MKVIMKPQCHFNFENIKTANLNLNFYFITEKDLLNLKQISIFLTFFHVLIEFNDFFLHFPEN